MDGLLEDSLIPPSRLPSAFGEATTTAIDMYEALTEVVIEANVPGVKTEELHIPETAILSTG